MKDEKLMIGQRIRDFRVKNHLTQAQLAEDLDVSSNFISEIETGKKNISIETLKSICLKYNLSADYLLFGKDQSSDHLLIKRLSNMPLQDIKTVIEYLQALLKMKMVEKRFSDSDS